MNAWVPLIGTRRFAPLSRGFSSSFLGDPIFFILIPFQLAAKAFAEGGEVSLNSATGQLRRGRRIIDVSAVDRAKIEPDPDDLGISWLRLSAGERFEFLVQLSDVAGSVLPDQTRLALLEMIPMTTIAYPNDPFDPNGKSSRRSFPHHLDREGVVEVLRRSKA